MAITLSCFALYEKLFRSELKSAKSVIELGSQDVTVPQSVTYISSIFRDRGIAADPVDYIRKPAREFYEKLGMEYQAIDIDGREGTIQLDLNTAQIPGHLQSRFDLVTNHGTTEHVFDQANCFKVMHNLCKPSGLMLHSVPCQGYMLHCLFSYRPAFFFQLARFNRYRTLGVWTSPRGSHDLIPFDRANPTPEGDHLIIALLQKRHEAPMEPPYDVTGGNRERAPIPVSIV